MHGGFAFETVTIIGVYIYSALICYLSLFDFRHCDAVVDSGNTLVGVVQSGDASGVSFWVSHKNCYLR